MALIDLNLDIDLDDLVEAIHISGVSTEDLRKFVLRIDGLAQDWDFTLPVVKGMLEGLSGEVGMMVDWNADRARHAREVIADFLSLLDELVGEVA